MSELVLGSVLAGYRIESVAGRGGMGVVYRATQLALERVVALKVIAPELASDPAFRARFKRESLTAASIDHPNVIAIHDAREDDGVLFISMRYIEGTDLRETIAREGRLEPRRATRIVSLVASALDAAHEAGLVHRDVKPANVLLANARGEEQVYLTDFGLTKQTNSESGMTKTGMFVGTLDYVAPEQLGGGPVDARTDIYSLGCVLYQALTGAVPYPRDSDIAKMFAHASEPPPSPRAAAPDLPAAFDSVIVRAMAKDPNGRYLSAGDLGRAALAAAQGLTLSRTERNVAEGEASPASAATAVAATEFGRQPPVRAGVEPPPLVVGARDVPTQFGASPPPFAGAPAAVAEEARRGGRRGRRIGLAALGLAVVAVAAVLALVLPGGSTKGSQLPGYGRQGTAGAKFAYAHYPGKHRPKSGFFDDCVNPATNDGTAVPAGRLVRCDWALHSGVIELRLRVISNDPIQFGSPSPSDCVLNDGFGGKSPCP